MKRGKNFFENDNMLIYVGTVVFILLAISLGIIMYMTTKTGVRIENSEQFSEKTNDNTETVTNEIGKTVEEQENKMQNNEQTEEIVTNEEETVSKEKNSTSNTTTSKDKTTTEAVEKNKETEVTSKPDEPDTNANAPVEKKPQETKKEITFIKPTNGEIICGYAKDNLIYSETLKEWITHTAIDIKADKTSVIKSSADGVVKSIVNDPRYGLTVVVQHDEGYETVYSNLLTAEFVVVGEEIKQGQTIGTAGNTSSFESSMECHLHFELLKDGEYLDPAIYLK